MKKRFISFLFFAFIVGVCCLLPHKQSQAASVSAPTLIGINQKGAANLYRPLITGLTEANTDVLVYIDDKFIDIAHINAEHAVTNNFYFQPDKPLDLGSHSLKLIARSKTTLDQSLPMPNAYFTVYLIPAPTLVSPNEKTVTSQKKPVITGLTLSDTFVHIYIDGVYNGKTPIVQNNSGTANFAYHPFLNLAPGSHQIQASAEDQYGHKSRISMPQNFEIEAPLPSPTILNKENLTGAISKNGAKIAGVVPNNVKVNIYLDHRLIGTISAQNGVAGIANFAYALEGVLTNGPHVVYTTAMDVRGKESPWSEPLHIYVIAPGSPRISQAAASETEDQPNTSSQESIKDASEDEQSADTTDKQLNVEKTTVVIEENKENSSGSNIGAVIESNGINGTSSEQSAVVSEENEKSAAGLFDESKKRLGKLNLNLIIFILFLIAIILWIIWVNRELIKEKREKNIKDEKDAQKEKESQEPTKPTDENNPPKK